jgi:hypothetical protein
MQAVIREHARLMDVGMGILIAIKKYQMGVRQMLLLWTVLMRVFL